MIPSIDKTIIAAKEPPSVNITTFEKLVTWLIPKYFSDVFFFYPNSQTHNQQKYVVVDVIKIC